MHAHHRSAIVTEVATVSTCIREWFERVQCRLATPSCDRSRETELLKLNRGEGGKAAENGEGLGEAPKLTLAIMKQCMNWLLRRAHACLHGFGSSILGNWKAHWPVNWFPMKWFIGNQLRVHFQFPVLHNEPKPWRYVLFQFIEY